MAAHPLNLSESTLTRLLSHALDHYQDPLQLARSPLANSSLIEPALILDPHAPTADERGRALRVVLRWACNRLAPTPPCYPIGMTRPFDDPTWRDPIWWRYNILRHRYINPLQQSDLQFVGCDCIVDALINLTGIPGRGTLFDERQQAIYDLTALLHRQLLNPQCDAELRRTAIDELYHSLQACEMAQDLLKLAATFHMAFPSALLLEMASEKAVQNPHDVLHYLVTRRFLLPGDDDGDLLIPPILQEYLYARQPKSALIWQHEYAAQFFLKRQQTIQVTWHLMMSEHPTDAANILLAADPARVPKQELQQALVSLTQKQLPTLLWCRVQLALSDLLLQAEQREQAIDACRRALGAVTDLYWQAHIYRRIGKIYQEQNVMQALRYYQLAEELLEPGDPEYWTLLQERAQLHAQRSEWEKAEKDLKLALLKLDPAAQQQRLGAHVALSRLYEQQKLYNKAVHHAQQALDICQDMQDWAQLARLSAHLGQIYLQMGAPDAALTAYQQAQRAYCQLGDLQASAALERNIDLARRRAGRPAQTAGYGDLLPEEQAALELARRDGQVTCQTLTQHTAISKSTAKRKLAGLVERGLLRQIGQGRSTFYRLPEA